MSKVSLSPNPSFFDVVRQRRAMRRLKPDPVPLALVRKVLEAGVQAPSGMNSQPCAFVAVQGDEGRRWFADHYKADTNRNGTRDSPGAVQ